jgi:fatty-acyl-CoA synthase
LRDSRVRTAWQERTVWELLLSTAIARRSHEALVSHDDDGIEHRVTYDELVQRSQALADGFVSIGVRRGDALAIWMTNRVEFVYVFLAALRIGAILVPLNTRLKDDEVAHVLSTSRARHLIMLDRFRAVDFVGMLNRICPEWPSATAGMLFSPSLPDLRNVVVLRRSVSSAPPGGGYELSALLLGEATGASSEIAVTVQPRDLAAVVFTSGSTGTPKGVMLEQWGLVTNSLLHTARINMTESDRFFNARPMFHSGGFCWGIMSILACGGVLVFDETWNPKTALELMERERCTISFCNSTMNRDMVPLLQSRPWDLRSLRLASYLDEQQLKLFGVLKTFAIYGLTEAYAPAAIHSIDDSLEKMLTTSGRALDGVEIRAVDPDGRADVASGEVGECYLRGMVMRGYWGLPVESLKAIDPEGWLHTEDLITIDRDGYIKWVGRIKSMLKVGGENVSAEEVEACILRYPGVAACCVIGVADERMGEIARAYVVERQKDTLDTDGLRAWTETRLASFKVPKEIRLVDSLPITASGKVDRSAVGVMAGIGVTDTT